MISITTGRCQDVYLDNIRMFVGWNEQPSWPSGHLLGDWRSFLRGRRDSPCRKCSASPCAPYDSHLVKTCPIYSCFPSRALAPLPVCILLSDVFSPHPLHIPHLQPKHPSDHALSLDWAMQANSPSNLCTTARILLHSPYSYLPHSKGWCSRISSLRQSKTDDFW